jgi:hypothetical protein
LDEDINLPPAIQQLIMNQLADLKTAFDSLRDHKYLQPAQG